MATRPPPAQHSVDGAGRMKSLHVPFGFYPDPCGGTEVYVAALATELEREGHQAVIAAPGRTNTAYRHQGLQVHRLATGDGVSVREMYGGGLEAVSRRFGEVLEQERPDIVHLHAFTPAASIRLVREAHRRSLPVVFTYHTPTASCLRGTMMLDGRAPCDGRLDVARCTRCTLEARGVPGVVAGLVASLPPLTLSRGDGPMRHVWTSVGYATPVAAFHQAVRALLAEVDRIVAPRGWVESVLSANGVPAWKIVRSAQPLCVPAGSAWRQERTGPLAVAFLGRIDPTKGLDVLVRAVRLLPSDVPLQVNIFGVVEEQSGTDQWRRLQSLAGSDPRLAFMPAVSADMVSQTLAAHDLLAVPSQWMETGPLVVLEAAAAGIGVVGSSLGGIAELVQDEVNGRLVADFASPEAWAAALGDLAAHPAKARAFGRRAVAPRQVSTVASEMLEVYTSLLRRGAAAAPAGSPLGAR